MPKINAGAMLQFIKAIEYLFKNSKETNILFDKFGAINVSVVENKDGTYGWFHWSPMKREDLDNARRNFRISSLAINKKDEIPS